MRSTTLLFAALSLWMVAPAQSFAQAEILVPAYFYPLSWDEQMNQWDDMQAALASGVRITAIMNPTNGPGADANAPHVKDYAAAVKSFQEAGGKVLGYVYTCYGVNNCKPEVPPVRTAPEVIADAEKYRDWYGVDGIFLDELSNVEEERVLSFYAEVSSGLKALRSDWVVVGNPGAPTPPRFFDFVETIVTFENVPQAHAAASAVDWAFNRPPRAQAQLVYNATTADTMRAAVRDAVARNVLYIYVTDDVLPNQWDRLPTYWLEEVEAVRSANRPQN